METSPSLSEREPFFDGQILQCEISQALTVDWKFPAVHGIKFQIAFLYLTGEGVELLITGNVHDNLIIREIIGNMLSGQKIFQKSDINMNISGGNMAVCF